MGAGPCSWAQNPNWSRVFAAGSVCLKLLLADEFSRSIFGSQTSTRVVACCTLAEMSVVLRRIPRRCELVWATLPWVGAGGSRSKHRHVWNCNGGDLFDILKEHHLKAANTFHAARARSWTWQQQRQDKQRRHRLDFFVVPMAAQRKCQVDCDSPVNLSGYRDHRPVGLLIPRRRRWKQ